MIHHLTVPISDEAISALAVGDQVTVTGVIFTARDAAHKYMVEKFVKTDGQPPESEQALYDLLKEKLDGGVIYHCGPVVAKRERPLAVRGRRPDDQHPRGSLPGPASSSTSTSRP